MLAVGGLVVSATMSHAEVAEGVRAAIAAYTHALDDGRTDDVVASYCPDGVFDMPGPGPFEGHDALREAYAAWRSAERHVGEGCVRTCGSWWAPYNEKHKTTKHQSK